MIISRTSIIVSLIVVTGLGVGQFFLSNQFDEKVAPTHTQEVTNSDRLSTATATFKHAVNGDDAQLINSDEIASLKTLNEEVSLLKRQVSQLRSELDGVKHRSTNALSKSALSNSAEAPTQEEAATETDPTAVEAAEAETRAKIALVESDFRKEPVDSQWSMETKTQIHSAFESMQISQDNIKGIECRSKTCRLELAGDSSHDPLAPLPPVLAKISRTLPSMSSNHIDQGNGAYSTVLYLSAN